MERNSLSKFISKVLSLLLAIVIWLVVANVDDYKTTKHITGIEIEFINGAAITEKNKVYEVPKGTTVDVTVKGKRSVLEKLTGEDFKAVADLSKMSLTNAVPVQVSAISSYIGKDLTITYEENAIIVVVENKLKTQFPITVNTISEVADGYAIRSKTATPNLITVEGAESVVKNIHDVIVNVDVNKASQNLTAVASPIFIDGNGEVIDSEKIQYDVKQVDVSVEVMKTKEISVVVSPNGEIRSGYAIASIDYQPTSIEVVGEPEVLAEFEELLIDDIDVNNAYKDVETSINIEDYLPAGATLVGGNAEIMIKIAIEKVIEKEFRINAMDVTLVGKRNDTNYAFKNFSGYNFMVKGLKKDVESLTVAELLPSIDVTGYGPGVYTFSITMREVEGVQILDTITVELEIRKQ